jgi:4-aminobutyrate aminotransferase-like enzyme
MAAPRRRWRQLRRSVNTLLLFMVGNRIHVTPPLVLTAQQAREGVDLLDRVLGVVA